MNKGKLVKATGSTAAAFLIAGTTAFTAFAAMPEGTVVIGNKAFDLGYANSESNYKEIRDAIVAGGDVYVKAPNGTWYANSGEKLADASSIPAVEYKNAEGKVTKYDAKDGDVVKETTGVKVESVSAISNNKILVTLDKDTTLSTSDFSIVKKDTTTAVAVKNVVKEADKKFVVETEALTGGQSYTVTVSGKTANFTGIAADTTAPTMVKVSSTDTNVIDIEFSDRMDFASATNVANYTLNKDAKVVKAELDSTRTKVKLTTEGLKRNIVYSLTTQNVQNSDGKAMTKVIRTITATEDRVAPRVTTLQVQNNHMIVVKFNDVNGMDKEALENVGNYSINDLKVLKVEAYDLDEDDLYETAVITTEPQTTNKSYTLTMSNLTDNSTLKNALGTTLRGFRGASEDKVGPVVKVGSVASENNNTVNIEFTDTNALDKASIEDISNYEITFDNGQVLPITSAKLWYDTYPENYTAGSKGVTLTTAQQEIGKSYRLTVKAVKDEFGNELKAISGTNYAKYTFLGTKVDTEAPYVKKVEYVSPTKVRLTFNEKVSKDAAQDPTNYVFNNELGSAIKAVRNPNSLGNNVVELTTQAQTGNKSYTITMNNIEDYYGNMLSNAKAYFVSTSDTLDITAPSVSYVTSMNNEEVHVYFSEPLNVKAALPSMTIQEWNTATGAFTGTPITLTAQGFIDEGQTAVFKAGTKLGDKNYKIATLTGAKDIAGNELALEKDAAERYLFAGTSAANAPAEVEYIEQINAKTIRVHFNEPVIMPTAPTGFKNVSKTDGFTKNTYSNSWDMESIKNLEVGKELLINFTACATDIAGLGVADAADTTSSTTGTTKFTPYLEDLAKPVITGVVATNKDKVTITYDKALSPIGGGTYKVYYLDNNNNKVYVYSGAGTVGSKLYNLDNEVTLTPTTSLVGSKTYYLEPMSAAIDIAGNRADITGIKLDFPGSDVKVDAYITGVKILNGKTINVLTGKDIKSNTDVKVYEYDAANKVKLVDLNATIDTTDGRVNTTKDKQFALSLPVLQGKKYIVDVTFADNTTESYVFEGNTPGIGAYIEKGAHAGVPGSLATLGYSALDSKAYNIEVYEAPAVGQKATSYVKNEYTGNGNVFTSTSTGGGTIAVDTKGTDTGTDDVITFTIDSKITEVGKEFYVVLTDVVDTTRVVYAEKVAVGFNNASGTDLAARDAAVAAAETAVATYETTGVAADETAARAAIAAAKTAGANVTVTDALTARVDAKKASIDAAADAQAIADFKAAHATVLALKVDTVAITNKAAVNAAITAYGSLTTGAQAGLTAENTLLTSLSAKITELEAAADAADAADVATAKSAIQALSIAWNTDVATTITDATTAINGATLPTGVTAVAAEGTGANVGKVVITITKGSATDATIVIGA